MPENFISAYLDHTSIYESPKAFWRWSAYSTISTILKDRCYIKNGDSFLFPNLYILLLAESSGHRKNRPVEFSETVSIASSISGVKTISGRASVQAILDELARTETDPKTGKVVKLTSATFYSTELSAGIVADPEGLKILTDIYDFKPNAYKNRLRTGPSFDLQRIVFSMFTASNQEMLQGLFDTSIIRGGFLARTLLIIPDEFRPSNSLMRLNHEVLKLSKERVITLARNVSQLTGEFQIEESAISEYETWYNPFRQDYAKHKEVSGVIGRIHTHVLKIAMILAANDLNLCILKKHIEQAIDECRGLLPNYNIFTMSHAKHEVGTVGGIVITSLLEAKDYMLSRKMLMRLNWQNFDSETLEKAITGLAEAGLIQIHQLRDGLAYQLTQQCLDMIKGGAK